jgi:hypothetical protein
MCSELLHNLEARDQSWPVLSSSSIERGAATTRCEGQRAMVAAMGFKARKRSTTRSEAKMVPTKVSVQTFVNGLVDERRRREATALISMMKKITGEKPVMWGPSIIGFGSYHYKYASGREGDAPRVAFSPRSAALTVYCVPVAGQRELLRRLGPNKTTVSCLYIRRLDDVDVDILRALVERSFKEVNERYPA